MGWINFIADKFSRGTEGHIDAVDLAQKCRSLESEKYHCVFDLEASQLKVEFETGEFTPDGKKIYTYHAQAPGGVGELTFNKYDGPARPAFNLVQFDFDSEDVNVSFKDAKGFIEWLGVEEYHLAFSGSKGFHVALPFEHFGLEASPELPRILHDLAAHLVAFFPTMDVKVYNANRKFRILNTKHSKTGLYKTLVTPSMSLEEIKSYASKRRDAWYPDYQVAGPCAVLVEALQTSKKVHSQDGGGTFEAPSIFESYDGKTCIKRLIEDKCPTGEKNNTILVIINDLLKTGKTFSHASEVVEKWGRDNNNAEGIAKNKELLADIYSGSKYYNHGCQDSTKAAKCSAKCPLWKKLDPEKRPVPVDAPKSAFKISEATKKPKKMPAGEFIKSFITQTILKIDLQGNWTFNGKPTNQAVVQDLIYCEALAGKNLIDACGMQTINSHLNIWADNQKEILLRDLRTHLAFTSESKELDKWLLAVKPNADLVDLAVMKHWLWQVKRKLNDKNVSDHVMPIFSGLSGSGKSVAIRKLISPLNKVSINQPLDFLNDDRHDFKLIENFVMFFDEMAGAKKADIGALKNKITLDYVAYRKLGVNATIRGTQNCSFIAATNNDTIDMIQDPTSVRRFYEFKIDSIMNWEVINGVDVLGIWRSIDENNDSGFWKESSEEISKRQEAIRSMDSVEEWLEEYKLRPTDEDAQEVQAWAAYEAYKTFMEDQNQDRSVMKKNKFGRLMREHKIDAVEKTKGIFYRVSKNIAPHLKGVLEVAPTTKKETSNINF